MVPSSLRVVPLCRVPVAGDERSNMLQHKTWAPNEGTGVRGGMVPVEVVKGALFRGVLSLFAARSEAE